MEIRATEEIAREVIEGHIQELLGLTNPTLDNNLAAWMMAEERAKRMVATINTVVTAISARPVVRPGADALRAIATLNPAEKEAFDEIEAQAIERAHPTTFNMPDFAATVCGMRKPA